MENTLPFGEILEAADNLPIADQESLRDILTKRIIERRRNELAQEIREAKKEYEAGQCKPVTPDELMNELLS
ncbi:MAG: periplasmic heavy metal sensor [Proteobacteria bacterium]|nr:periplasmic heavy metal sensor [Pseudomonadota bacterium]